MKRFGFPKALRLLKSTEFDRVMRRRFSTADGLVVLYAAQGAEDSTRLGLVVSRKCGNAVTRNLWKRSLREAFRLVLPELPVGLDLVVLPRRGATPDVGRLQESLKRLAADLNRRLTGAATKSGGDST